MNIFITTFYTLITICVVASLTSCGDGAAIPPPQDSVQYISPDFLGNDPQPTKEPKPKKKPKKEKVKKEKTNNSASSTVKETREGNAAQDFANAMKKHIIRMVYPDDYQSSSAKVLNSDNSENAMTIEMEVTWKDRWVKEPYRIKGILEVNKDGTNAQFRITEKNAEAEALEYTYDQFKTTLQLDRI